VLDGHPEVSRSVVVVHGSGLHDRHLVAFVAAAAFRQLAGMSRLGWGPKVAVLGGLALTVGAWIPQRWLGPLPSSGTNP